MGPTARQLDNCASGLLGQSVLSAKLVDQVPDPDWNSQDLGVWGAVLAHLGLAQRAIEKQVSRFKWRGHFVSCVRGPSFRLVSPLFSFFGERVLVVAELGLEILVKHRKIAAWRRCLSGWTQPVPVRRFRSIEAIDMPSLSCRGSEIKGFSALINVRPWTARNAAGAQTRLGHLPLVPCSMSTLQTSDSLTDRLQNLDTVDTCLRDLHIVVQLPRCGAPAAAPLTRNGLRKAPIDAGGADPSAKPSNRQALPCRKKPQPCGKTSQKDRNWRRLLSQPVLAKIRDTVEDPPISNPTVAWVHLQLRTAGCRTGHKLAKLFVCCTFPVNQPGAETDRLPILDFLATDPLEMHATRRCHLDGLTGQVDIGGMKQLKPQGQVGRVMSTRRVGIQGDSRLSAAVSFADRRRVLWPSLRVVTPFVSLLSHPFLSSAVSPPSFVPFVYCAFLCDCFVFHQHPVSVVSQPFPTRAGFLLV